MDEPTTVEYQFDNCKLEVVSIGNVDVHILWIDGIGIPISQEKAFEIVKGR